MNILFAGCSWTYGDELENNRKDRFSKLISDHYSATEFNISIAGNTNYKIVSDAIESIESNKIDFCIYQVTGENRLSIPINDNIKILRQSNTKNCKFKNEKYIHKLIFDSNYSLDTYKKYNYPFIVLFNEYLKSKNIPSICVFLKDRYLNWFDKKDILEYSLESIVPKNMRCPGLHPNEDGHKLIAKKLIEEIDKRL